MSDSNNNSVDVLVVGAGNAAITAALAAHAEGAKVAVLEKSDKALRGGNTRFTGGIFRHTYNGPGDLLPIVMDNDNADDVIVKPYTRDDYLGDMARVTGGRSDPELTDVLIDRSYDTVRWMADLGVPFEFSRVVGGVSGSEKVTLAPGGAIRSLHEGVGLSANLFRLLDEADIPVFYETRAHRIVTDNSGKAAGVEVRGPEGGRTINCRALVIGSGGFQASPEMRTSYMGPDWSLVKVRGTRFNTGDLTRAAIDIGAQSYGEWSGCHATPIDSDSPTYGDLNLTDKTNRLSYLYGVMLNLEGERFVDEGEDLVLYTYAKMGREILKQRNAVTFQVFDQKTVPLLEPRYSTGVPIEADTIEELAEKVDEKFGRMGFGKAKFIQSLHDFNAAVQEGEFDPTLKDEKATKGLNPEKTNWAAKIDEPPYVVYGVSLGITFTFGGIRINTDAEVLDHLERPIPGLFATGEATGGFFYINYPGGAGLMRGAVFGKIGGTNAASAARDD
ncbi:MAG: FAD-dependent tricarballylate dehydrogenase TcuA [Nitrospinota bacterium]|nr:FAD-dependent tricarballylate dehydrogenase TcuA [Nitrospinota bacterium]